MRQDFKKFSLRVLFLCTIGALWLGCTAKSGESFPTPDENIPRGNVTQSSGTEKCPYDADWVACKEASDCVVVASNCGWKTSVNKKYVREMEQFNQCLGQTPDCSPVPKDFDKKKFKAQCGMDGCNAYSF